MFLGTQGDHTRSSWQLENDKSEADRQLTRTQDILRQHVQKLNEQVICYTMTVSKHIEVP